MFERRARVVLALLILASFGLLARAAQVQLVQSEHWRLAAEDTLQKSILTEAARGRLLDRKGRVLAEDVPCNDAAVAFWFVRDPVDEGHLKRLARDLARKTDGYYAADTPEQIRRVEAHLPVAADALQDFWEDIAAIGEVTTNEMASRRRTTIARVEARRRDVVLRRFQRAQNEHEQGDLSPWWRRWLLGEGDAPPELQDFEEPIADETQAHVVLRDLTNDQYNALIKLKADLPPTLGEALVLRASRTRRYPAHRAAAHVVGRVGEVGPDEIAEDPELGDELRRYLPGDLAGLGGLEQIAERRLRGTRGRIIRDLEHDERRVADQPAEGEDVTVTLDVELSRDVREAFEHVDFRWPERTPGEPSESRTTTGPMLGSAVVIDVATGGVLAMASAPDFDPNTFNEEAADLYADEMARPAINRAARFAAVPGSTVKPVVGLGAITDGIIGANETIECTGYLTVDVRGKLTKYTHTGRCWTAKMYGQYASVQGHQTPPDIHPTPGLNLVEPPPGHLTFADALQRSCNVYFETLGHRGGTEALSRWLGRFGIGEPTGIGLPEREGLVPTDRPVQAVAGDWMAPIRNNWFGAIGQGSVQATPLQMADVAATLARDGVRRRPSLIADEPREAEDLKLDSDALILMHRGLKAVVNTRGGSGHNVNERMPLEIAGKTGSAQADLLTMVERDEDGHPVLDEKGRVQYRRIREVSTRDVPNPAAPWYRRSNDPSEERIEVTHAWFVGYAPADDPKVAFAVFVEYGGSGGIAGGSVASQVVQALVKHGYLEQTREENPDKPGYYLVAE